MIVVCILHVYKIYECLNQSCLLREQHPSKLLLELVVQNTCRAIFYLLREQHPSKLLLELVIQNTYRAIFYILREQHPSKILLELVVQNTCRSSPFCRESFV
jgi:hypothetical protein